jgi:hypothetical protein
MSYAGLDGIELMHTALRLADSVETIRALSKKYALPVIGTSFGGDMWDRAQHEAFSAHVTRFDIGRRRSASRRQTPSPRPPSWTPSELLQASSALCQSRASC